LREFEIAIRLVLKEPAEALPKAGVLKDGAASWFETAHSRLLTMRPNALAGGR
jgi:hypothetical protein